MTPALEAGGGRPWAVKEKPRTGFLGFLPFAFSLLFICLLTFPACVYLQTPPLEGQVVSQEKGQPLTTVRLNLVYIAHRQSTAIPFPLASHWTVSDGEGNFTLEGLEDFYWNPYFWEKIGDFFESMGLFTQETSEKKENPSPPKDKEGWELKEIRLLVYVPNYQSQELMVLIPPASLETPPDALKPIIIKVGLVALSPQDEKAFSLELKKLRRLLEPPSNRLYLPDPDFLNSAEYEFIRRFPQSREAEIFYLTIAKRTYHKEKDPQAALKIYQEYLDRYPQGFLRQGIKDEMERIKTQLSSTPQ